MGGGGLRQESQLGWSVKRTSQTVLQQLSGAKHFSLLRFRFGHLVKYIIARNCDLGHRIFIIVNALVV